MENLTQKYTFKQCCIGTNLPVDSLDLAAISKTEQPEQLVHACSINELSTILILVPWRKRGMSGISAVTSHILRSCLLCIMKIFIREI